jgi:hypothetical protein
MARFAYSGRKRFRRKPRGVSKAPSYAATGLKYLQALGKAVAVGGAAALAGAGAAGVYKHRRAIREGATSLRDRAVARNMANYEYLENAGQHLPARSRQVWETVKGWAPGRRVVSNVAPSVSEEPRGGMPYRYLTRSNGRGRGNTR